MRQDMQQNVAVKQLQKIKPALRRNMRLVFLNKSNTKHKYFVQVALECLSYHATASGDDTYKLVNDIIPSAETYNLYSFQFHGKLILYL